MLFQRVLCPIDFSPRSALLVRHAIGLTTGASPIVIVLNAVEPLLFQAAVISGSEDELRRDVDAALRKVVEEARRRADSGPVVHTRVVDGDAHTAILEAASLEQVDAIVMGTHGAGGLAKAWFGSTLERVLRETTVPVLAIPPRGAGLAVDESSIAVTHVVAAIDFDEPSKAAACAAARYARQCGAALTLLHVIPSTPVWGRLQHAVDEQRKLRRERAERELSLLADELSQGGPATRIVVLEGAPSEQVAAFGGPQPGTLIVMGLRVSNGRFVARPGAVAYRVLCAGTHPVLVVPSNVCDRTA